MRAHQRSQYRADPARRASIRSHSATRAADNRARVRAHLSSHPCVDCGEADATVLEFDHRDPRTKRANVSSLLQSAHAWATVQREIDKCDVRCANCHRRRTAESRGRTPDEEAPNA
jgi:hypothetical protein